MFKAEIKKNISSVNCHMAYKKDKPPFLVKKIFTTSSGLLKYLSPLPVSFVVDREGYYVYFYNKKLYQMKIKNKKLITTRSIDIDDKNVMALTANHEKIVLVSNNNITILDHNLQIRHIFKNKYFICSKPLLLENKIYLVDISDSLLEIDDKGYIKKFMPEFLGSQFNAGHQNILVTASNIMYGGSLGCFYVLDMNLNLVHTVPINSLNLKHQPMLFQNKIWFFSDLETIIVDHNDQFQIYKKISLGSFTKPILYKSQLVCCEENRITFIDMYGDTKVVLLDKKHNIIASFITENSLFVLDTRGRIILVNDQNYQLCDSLIKTKYTPLVYHTGHGLYILTLNDSGELEMHTLKKIKI